MTKKNDLYVIQGLRAQESQRSKVQEVVGVSFLDTHCTKSNFQFLTSQLIHSAFSAPCQRYPVEGAFLESVMFSSFMGPLRSPKSIAVPVAQSNNMVCVRE